MLPLDFVFLYVLKGGSVRNIKVMVYEELVVVFPFDVICINSNPVLFIPGYKPVNMSEK